MLKYLSGALFKNRRHAVRGSYHAEAARRGRYARNGWRRRA